MQSRTVTSLSSSSFRSKPCRLNPSSRSISIRRQMLIVDSPSVRKRNHNDSMDGVSGNQINHLYVRASSSDALAGGSGSTRSSQPSGISPVIFGVAVACMGAFSFGFNLAVINGPLAAISADLGFAGNAALQGTVSILD